MSGSTSAPVLIVTYDRLEHLKKTIRSLRGNLLATQTDLFIASDFQETDSDAERVTAVRNYLATIDGFKSITVFERDTNLGAEENCLAALEVISGKHDRFIIMEDDLVTAPGFLTFINQAFHKFGDNTRVFSITGYCPPISIPKSYEFDAFFLKRMSAWGCGFTKERYASTLDITPDEYYKFIANKKVRRAFVKGGGEDMLAMLELVADGSLNARDVRCMYTQFLMDQYTIYPTRSLVSNIGFDGTGINCGKTDMFDVTLSDKTSFSFPDEVIIDPRIVGANYRFRSGPGLGTNLVSKTKGLVRKWSGKCLSFLKFSAVFV